MLLHPEARSWTVSADPTWGKQGEPLIKVIAALRGLEYKTKDDREVMLSQMNVRVGQDAYQSPTVFNFFQPGS